MIDSRATEPRALRPHNRRAREQRTDLLWSVVARVLGFGAILSAFAFAVWGMLAPFF